MKKIIMSVFGLLIALTMFHNVQAENNIKKTTEDNVNLTSTMVIKSGENITLEDTLVRDASFTKGPMIEVEEGATLTLNGAHIDGNNVNVNYDTQQIPIAILVNGTLNIEGNSVIENHVGAKSAIIVKGIGQVTLNDGSIQNNQYNYTRHGSSGIELLSDSALFTMNGGKITNNHSTSVGAVAITKGKMIMNDGEISYNVSTTENQGAGGIAIGSMSNLSDLESGDLVLNNGLIKGNTVGSYGGGIAGWRGTLTIVKAKIIDNKAVNDNKIPQLTGTGGGIYLDNHFGNADGTKGSVNLNNTIITDNDAMTGGAVYICGGGSVDTEVNEGVAMFGNTASLAGTTVQFDETSNNDSYLSVGPRQLGGGLVEVFNDSPRYQEGDLPLTHSEYNNGETNWLYFKSEADNNALNYADIIISNNTAGYTGGGMGVNGKVIFGNDLAKKLTVKKVWEDNNSSDRPVSVKVNLKNDNNIIQSVVLNEDNNWYYEFLNLPASLDFEVEETSVDGYTTNYEKTVDNDGNVAYVITNTLEDNSVKTKDIKVIKKWHDNNQESKRPLEIEVALYENSKLFKKVMLNSDNDWQYLFKELNFDNDYSIKEIKVPNDYEVKYEKEVSENGDVTFIINNYLKVNPTNPFPGTGNNAFGIALALLGVGGLGYASYRRVFK